MQKLANDFSTSMESDIHYISTHGVSGRCVIEHELGFLPSSRFGHLTRFFRRQLLTNPSTYLSF
jgi:hypothetical protein